MGLASLKINKIMFSSKSCKPWETGRGQRVKERSSYQVSNDLIWDSSNLSKQAEIATIYVESNVAGNIV